MKQTLLIPFKLFLRVSSFLVHQLFPRLIKAYCHICQFFDVVHHIHYSNDNIPQMMYVIYPDGLHGFNTLCLMHVHVLP